MNFWLVFNAVIGVSQVASEVNAGETAVSALCAMQLHDRKLNSISSRWSRDQKQYRTFPCIPHDSSQLNNLPIISDPTRQSPISRDKTFAWHWLRANPRPSREQKK